jgi:uncharacterized protein YbbC (DUF1343 family)
MIKKKIRLGLERALTENKKYLKNRRIGLICNQASVNHRFEHAADLFFKHHDLNLTTLFGPQHGIRGDVQDNMVETSHSVDKNTGLPVYSLYSETREPTSRMLEEVDTLVFDLQDIGGRVYTFIYTMAKAMESCARLGKTFVVCDRPNPINGVDVEGSLLEEGHESFVGLYPIPMRHGLTTGELASFFNREFDINCDLEIIGIEGWERELYLDETDCPWVMPSPNMPTIKTAIVFPGTVYFEGTQISEGRGTTKPFEFVGAPFIDSEELAADLRKQKLPGVIFRPTNFMPTFQKFAGESCGGVFLHVTDRKSFQPVLTGVAILKSILERYPENFKWKIPPYEYEFERNPFDVIDGSLKLRKFLEGKAQLAEIKKSWEKDEIYFRQKRKKHLLY